MYQILPMNSIFAILPMILTFFIIMSITMFWIQTGKKSIELNQDKNLVSLKKSILSLFISFDPKSSLNLLTKELNWIIPLMFLSIMFLTFWVKPSRLSTIKNSSINYFASQFEIALKSKKDSSKLMFVCLFFLIMLSNLSGLIPNSFTLTSHLTTNLFISVPMWLGFFIFGWIIFSNKMLAHLVPNGTPTPLISFMVLIELISTSIRPFTLSIRLMANMVSGHLLLTLLGNSMVNVNLIILGVMVVVQTMLGLLELGVCIIQAYVFCMLLTLYSDESDYFK